MEEKERYTPGDSGEIWYEHWHRYHFALPLVAGRKVLDAASGEGYGTALLSTVASHATGVDADAGVVAAARRRYGARGNLEYLEGRCEALPLADASVDAVVSFETMEHLPDPAALVREARRVMRADGLFIVSTPNREIYSEARDYSNPHHLHELSRTEFEQLLGAQFERVALFCQRVDSYSAIWPAATAPRKTTLLDADKADPAQPREGVADAMYWIAICGPTAAVQAAEGAVSLFSDRGHEVQAGAAQTNAHVAELRAYVRRLEAAYLASQEQLRALAQERDALAARANNAPAPGWNRR